jgi:DNA-binding response OmpR family regulator
LQAESPDLFLVDINLPDGSGLDFYVRLREAGYATPILILTANDTELDMVTGLESGADDYVTKPFSLAVLRARVDALLRRDATKARCKRTGSCLTLTHSDLKRTDRQLSCPRRK